MIEIILLLVIVALCGLIGWLEYNNRKERKSMLNALMSKTPADYISAELSENVKIGPDAIDDKGEFISEAELSNEEFEKRMNG